MSARRRAKVVPFLFLGVVQLGCVSISPVPPGDVWGYRIDGGVLLVSGSKNCHDSRKDASQNDRGFTVTGECGQWIVRVLEAPMPSPDGVTYAAIGTRVMGLDASLVLGGGLGEQCEHVVKVAKQSQWRFYVGSCNSVLLYERKSP